MDLKYFFNKVISLIYPNKCGYCSKVISHKDVICEECKKIIKPCMHIKKLRLKSCCEPVLCISIFKYTGKVKDAILKFKFYGYKEFSKVFTYGISAKDIQSLIKLRIDLITSVPLSRKRKCLREYNQAECFARNLSEKLNIPYKELLSKNVDNVPQHELSSCDRAQNVEGVYSVLNFSEVSGKNILLCDDIVTTGNTLGECVKILKNSGANKIVCFTIAFV